MFYFGIALFCTGIFLIQFILSLFFTEIDTDIDIDCDGVPDLTWTDFISFKGIIHFGIGFGWTMWFNQDSDNKLLATIIAIFVGLVFVVVLWLAYALTRRLESTVKEESGPDLVGREVEIYVKLSNRYSAYVTKEGSKKLITVVSDGNKLYHPGDRLRITKFKYNKYFID